MNFGKKNSIWIKSILEVLKTFKLLPFWSTICTSPSLIWNELWCLFYLSKFNLVVHTKCWKGAFCVDYEAKFCRGKASELSQAWSHTFLNLCHNSGHVDFVISGTGWLQKNRIFRFLKSSLKNHFLSKSKKCFRQCLLHEI